MLGIWARRKALSVFAVVFCFRFFAICARPLVCHTWDGDCAEPTIIMSVSSLSYGLTGAMAYICVDDVALAEFRWGVVHKRCW